MTENWNIATVREYKYFFCWLPDVIQTLPVQSKKYIKTPFDIPSGSLLLHVMELCIFLLKPLLNLHASHNIQLYCEFVECAVNLSFFPWYFPNNT
jgi:hypothetical protein